MTNWLSPDPTWVGLTNYCKCPKRLYKAQVDRTSPSPLDDNIFHILGYQQMGKRKAHNKNQMEDDQLAKSRSHLDGADQLL